MKSFFLLSAFGLAMAGSALSQDAPKQINWDGMKAEYKFDDPFVDLTAEQLMNLSMVARVRKLEERAKVSGKPLSAAMLEEKEKSKELLVKQGIDIDGLLAKRDEIKEQRTKRASMAVEELDGQLVSLSGFALPLEFEGKKVKEFLLVPWVGACIHTPPPPPNQIVHVLATEAFASKGMFEAVTVTGKIGIEKRVQELFLVDGKADINVSYYFDAGVVKKYKKPEESAK